MYGTTFSRVSHVGYELARHPQFAIAYLMDKVTRKSPLEQRLPWVSYSCISYLNKAIRPGMRVFEYGSGGSSAYFASKGCILKGVENHPEWHSRVVQYLQNTLGVSLGPEPGNSDITLVELPATPEHDHPNIGKYIDQIKSDVPWDVIFVDGVETSPPSLRADCIRIAPNYLAEKGILVLDDSYRREYSDVPGFLESHNFKRHEFWGVGPARLGVTKTDVYTRGI